MTMYTFTPPTIEYGPADPHGERLWVYYRQTVGITVLKNHDGTYTPVQFVSQDQMNEAAFTYLGGHEYLVDEDESIALLTAGYTTNQQAFGFGVGGFGIFGFGV